MDFWYRGGLGVVGPGPLVNLKVGVLRHYFVGLQGRSITVSSGSSLRPKRSGDPSLVRGMGSSPLVYSSDLKVGFVVSTPCVEGERRPTPPDHLLVLKVWTGRRHSGGVVTLLPRGSSSVSRVGPNVLLVGEGTLPFPPITLEPVSRGVGR